MDQAGELGGVGVEKVLVVVLLVIVLLGPLVPFAAELLVVLAQVRFGFGGQLLGNQCHDLRHDVAQIRVGNSTFDEQRIVAVCPLSVCMDVYKAE